MTFHYLKGMFQQQGQGTATVAVKEGMELAVNWAQSDWDAGEPSRGRKAETNGSFFLDSTLLGKTQKLHHQFMSPHLLPSEEGSSPETKRLWLGDHPPSAGFILKQPSVWWSALQTKALRGNRRKQRKLSFQRRRTPPAPPPCYPQPPHTPNLNKKIVRTMHECGRHTHTHTHTHHTHTHTHTHRASFQPKSCKIAPWKDDNWLHQSRLGGPR